MTEKETEMEPPRETEADSETGIDKSRQSGTLECLQLSGVNSTTSSSTQTRRLAISPCVNACKRSVTSTVHEWDSDPWIVTRHEIAQYHVHISLMLWNFWNFQAKIPTFNPNPSTWGTIWMFSPSLLLSVGQPCLETNLARFFLSEEDCPAGELLL